MIYEDLVDEERKVFRFEIMSYKIKIRPKRKLESNKLSAFCFCFDSKVQILETKDMIYSDSHSMNFDQEDGIKTIQYKIKQWN
jgi:hypothetical protein